MKSKVTRKRFPETPEEWEVVIAEAPGEDRAPTAEEEAAWGRAVIVRGGGYPAFKAAWSEEIVDELRLSLRRAKKMDIVQVDSCNLSVYLNLCQSYEGEFSAITDKKPNENGLFELDTQIGRNVLGYLLYEEKSPIGLAAVKAKSSGQHFEVCEFYVVPSFRKQALGKRFAIEIFKKHQGRWEIKQISGAEYATEFWRKTVGEFTGNNFQEDVYQDEYWGQVVRQQFVSTSPDPSKELKA